MDVMKYLASRYGNDRVVFLAGGYGSFLNARTCRYGDVDIYCVSPTCKPVLQRNPQVLLREYVNGKIIEEICMSNAPYNYVGEEYCFTANGKVTMEFSPDCKIVINTIDILLGREWPNSFDVMDFIMSDFDMSICCVALLAGTSDLYCHPDYDTEIIHRVFERASVLPHDMGMARLEARQRKYRARII